MSKDTTETALRKLEYNLPCPCGLCYDGEKHPGSITYYCEKEMPGWLLPYERQFYDRGISDFLFGVTWEDGMAFIESKYPSYRGVTMTPDPAMCWSWGWAFARDYEAKRQVVKAYTAPLESGI